MNEQNELDRYTRGLEAVLAGEKVGTDPGETGELLAISSKLAALDFSAQSRGRAANRRRLQLGLPAGGRRKAMQSKWNQALRPLMFAAALVAVILGLNWLLANSKALNLIPEPAAGTMDDTPTPPTRQEATMLHTEAATSISKPVDTGPLSPESSDADIRRVLQASTGSWQSLFVDARASTESKGQVYVEREQAWLIGASQSRWLSGLEGAAPSLLRVKAGIRAVLATADGERTPYTTLDPPIGSLADLLFPKAAAGREGSFEAVREETIAGRAAVVVEWSTDAGRVEDHFWVDALTGVILKWENLFPPPPDSAGRTEPSLVEVLVILFDPELPETLFDLTQPVPGVFFEGWPEGP